MNITLQCSFMQSCIPEIKRAIAEEYPDPTTYINTKYIGQHIFSHPDQYPVLGKYKLRFIKCAVTIYLSEIHYPKYKNRICGGVKNGQIFNRTATTG
jgi:hypothetical protein